MDQRLLRLEVELEEEALGRPMGEAAPDGEDDVGAFERGLRRPVVGEHAQPERVRLGNGPAAHHRRDDGRAEPVSERRELPRRAGRDDAPTRHDERALGRAQTLGRVLDQLRIACGPSRVKGLATTFALPYQEIRGQRQRDGPRPRRAEQMKGVLHGGGNVPPFGDGLRPARDGLEAVDLIRHLVERTQAFPDERRGNVGHEHEDGLGAREGFHKGRQHVGGPGPGGDHDHARPARGPRVAVGHEARALLVAGEDVRDVVLADQRVVDGEVVDSREPEDVPHALGTQNFHHPFTAGAELSHAYLSLVRGTRPRPSRGRVYDARRV